MSANPESAADFILAVDAGGTKTVAWLAQASGAAAHRILGRGRAGGGNPLTAGLDQATRAIADAIAAARRDANLPNARIARAVLSVAGAADPEVSGQLVRWALDTPLAERVAVVSDVLPVLAAGTDDGWGVALIAGTGSVAFARSQDGRTVRSGGWGYLLGDDGSGYAIGRAGLRHALENIDDPDPLTRRLLDELRASSTAELTKAIYRVADPRAAIASVAWRVIEAGDEGDPAANTILDAAAGDLAKLVTRTANALGLADQEFPLAVAGGVLVGSKHLRDRLETELRTMTLTCGLRVVSEPLIGCLRLATSDCSDLAVNWYDA